MLQVMIGEIRGSYRDDEKIDWRSHSIGWEEEGRGCGDGYCQDPYFQTLTVGRQRNVSRVLLCSLGLALGLRPLLSSLAQAIPTGIQSVSVALPLAPVCGSLIFCGGLLDGSGV
jgi:hypothetical protein